MDYQQRPYRKYGFRQQFKPYGQFVKSAGGTTYRAATAAQRSAAARIAAAALARRGPYQLPARSFSLPMSEKKFVDLGLTNIVFRLAATPPVAVSLCFPVQGAAAFNRVGQKITLKSLRIRGCVTNILTAVQQGGRILVVYDRQANAALPLWTDVIGAVTSAGAATTGIYDGNQLANRERFVILADEQMWLPSVTNTAGVLTNPGTINQVDKIGSMFNFERFIKLRDMSMQFNNTNGGTFADIQTGSLSIFCVVQTTDSSYNLAFTARTRYSDA